MTRASSLAPPSMPAPAAPQAAQSGSTAAAPVPPDATGAQQPAVSAAVPVASVTTTHAPGLPTHPAKTQPLVMKPAHIAAPSAAASVGGTLFALALVLGLIFALAWLARRMPGLAGMRGRSGLRVVAALPLGARERLVVVAVGDTQLLLGTGAGGTRVLHALETPLPEDTGTPPTPFAQLLAQRLGKKPA